MTGLEIVQLANTGLVVWNKVGPLVEEALQSGRDVSIEEVAEASGKSTESLANLWEAIQRAKAEGR